MFLLSRPKYFVSAFAGRLDGAAVAVGRLGVGAFGWPLAIGMGLGSGLFGIWHPIFVQGALQRRATLDFMRPVLQAIALASLATVTTALGIALVQRRRGAPSVLGSYLGVLRRCAFLSALPLVVLLLTRPPADREWFVLTLILATAAVVSYSAYVFFAVAAPPRAVGRASRAIAWGAVVLAALAYAVHTARAGIANHLRFNTGRADLGIYVNLFRESSQGRLFACSLCGSGRHPYSHFEPIVALLSPLYLAHPAAQTLIVIGCVIVASGAIPLYLFARRHLPEGAAVALSLAYLAYPALSEVALFDFHSVELAIPVLLWLLYSLEQRAMRGYYALAVVLVLLREDMGIVLATVGLHVLVSGGAARRVVAARTFALSALALIVTHFASSGGFTQVFTDVASAFVTGPRRALRPALVSELPTAVIERLFSEKKALHLAGLLAPLFALPLIGPGRVLLLYGGLLTLLAAAPFPGTPNAHEAALVIPFLFVLTVTALGRVQKGELALGKASPEALGKALALGVFVASLLSGLSLGGLGNNVPFYAGPRVVARDPSPNQIALDATLQNLAASWPRGTKVAASSALLPHLGGASRLYTLDDRAESDYVVAWMKQRPVARRLDSEESNQDLQRDGSYGDVRVYRPHYRRPLTAKLRQLEDE